jgi:hypothetical protein
VVKIEDYYFFEQNEQKKFLIVLEKADKNLDELLKEMFKQKIEFSME